MAACKQKSLSPFDVKKIRIIDEHFPYKPELLPVMLYYNCEIYNECMCCSGIYIKGFMEYECTCPKNLEVNVNMSIIYVNDSPPSEASYTIVHINYKGIINLSEKGLYENINMNLLDNDALEKNELTINCTSDGTYTKSFKSFYPSLDIHNFSLVKSFRGQKTVDKYALAFISLIQNIMKYEDTMQPKENAHISQKKKKK